jgi:DNA helicase-2/ATP-dependent DNA helicase PcrA
VQITLTTVHKAKGLEYDKVIYWPKKTRDSSAFYDYVVERILEANDMLDEGELEEESLRIDFVAFTRAKKELYVIAENARDYLNEKAEIFSIEPEACITTFEEKQKRAYNLFVNKDYDGAKELLETNNDWLKAFVENHFITLEHISFSRLTTDAYEYFTQNLLKLRQDTYATNLGSSVHDLIEAYLKGEKVNPGEEEKLYFENAVSLIASIKKDYPEFVEAEHVVNIELKKIVPTEDPVHFFGKIDAIFKKGNNYLIVDWKTSKSTGGASEYRRQLELYKRTYAEQIGIAPEQIQVLIGFIGIRKVINDGNIYSEVDERQPQTRVYQTLQNHFKKFLEWKADPESFFQDLQKTKADDPLIRSILEQYSKEKAS